MAKTKHFYTAAPSCDLEKAMVKLWHKTHSALVMGKKRQFFSNLLALHQLILQKIKAEAKATYGAIEMMNAYTALYALIPNHTPLDDATYEELYGYLLSFERIFSEDNDLKAAMELRYALQNFLAPEFDRWAERFSEKIDDFSLPRVEHVEAAANFMFSTGSYVRAEPILRAATALMFAGFVFATCITGGAPLTVATALALLTLALTLASLSITMRPLQSCDNSHTKPGQSPLSGSESNNVAGHILTKPFGLLRDVGQRCAKHCHWPRTGKENNTNNDIPLENITSVEHNV